MDIKPPADQAVTANLGVEREKATVVATRRDVETGDTKISESMAKDDHRSLIRGMTANTRLEDIHPMPSTKTSQEPSRPTSSAFTANL